MLFGCLYHFCRLFEWESCYHSCLLFTISRYVDKFCFAEYLAALATCFRMMYEYTEKLALDIYSEYI